MKVLVAHGDLSAGGGAEAYARGIIEALTRAGHQVGVLDVQGHRRPDGTSDRPWLLTWGARGIGQRYALWKYALVCRLLTRIAFAYDRVILSYGEGPALCRPSVRLLHAPAIFSDKPELLAALGAPVTGTGFRFRRVYARLCRRIALPDYAPATATVANSAWTARMAQAHADMTAGQILYPGVAAPPRPAKPPPRDPYRILALGRIVANKRLEEAVDLTDRLRALDLPVTLQILGRADGTYARRFLAKYRDHPHLILTPDADSAALAQALAKARIGFHGYRHEHFGIAVGEMIASGMIPLVFDGGGVCELVPDKRLRFRDAAGALAKAKALIEASEEDCLALSQRLRKTPALQAAGRFDQEIDALLANFLDAG